MGTLIELLAMAGFLAGVIVGELRDQADARRELADAVDRAAHDAWTAAFAATALLTDLSFPVVAVPSGEPDTTERAA